MSRKRILFIDDDHELLSVLNEIFSADYDCASFTNAPDALSEIRSSELSFDCIVCDLMMPGMNGLQFYEELKNIQPSLLTHIIFLTGGSFTHETDIFLSQPNIYHCEKPVQIKTIKTMVSNLIQNQK